MLDILHVMKSDKYGHFNPVKEREMQEWIGKNTGRLGRLAGSKAHRSHHQQLNWSHGRCKIWVEATETQGNTMGQRQNHKQRHHGQREKSEAASSKVTAFVKVQSKLHKCQHLLFTATKGRMLSSLEIAYLVKHCNVIKKKKFKFLSTTASLKSRKYPGAGKMKTSFINTVS